jgi:spoIIIJ-associated protein
VSDVVVEATGETVGEAKWAALRELERVAPGFDRGDVRFEVVSEGERGLLGVGYTPARVVAAVPTPSPSTAPAPAGEGEDAAAIRSYLQRVTAAIGATCSVTIEEREDGLVATLSGPDLGLLIGRHGQTIDALQYLANALARRRGSETRIVLDAAGYRSRRALALQSMARRTAEQASATGQRVALDPMTAVERRVVHEFLKDDPEVDTVSEGTEPNRFVVVVPKRSV